MTILNWLYWKKQQLIKKTANDAKTDLVVLGAEVPFTKRDDGYQDYAMTLADAVHAGCTENNTLYTGIYDNPSFAIGYPVLLKTCTKVIDTPGFPTFVPVDLQGWKVSGSVYIGEGLAGGAIYLGSVENLTGSFDNFPWKISGTVYIYDSNLGEEVYSTLANGADVWDDASGTAAQCKLQFIPDYYPGGFDLYLTYSQPSTGPGSKIEAVVSFEYEFLEDTNVEPTFTYYI